MKLFCSKLARSALCLTVAMGADRALGIRSEAGDYGLVKYLEPPGTALHAPVQIQQMSLAGRELFSEKTLEQRFLSCPTGYDLIPYWEQLHSGAWNKHYQLRYRGANLEGAVLVHSFSDGRTRMIVHSLPDTCQLALPTHGEFSELVPDYLDDLKDRKKVYVLVGDQWQPAWRLKLSAAEAPSKRLISAIDGGEITEEPLRFNVDAWVYEQDSRETQTSRKPLGHLTNSQQLDGSHFSVFGASPTHPRATPRDGVYDYTPSLDSPLFDQAQTYYALGKARAWFESVGYDGRGGAVKVFTNANYPDNAHYVPASEGPYIELGASGGTLQNLSKDADVITHEYGHHVVVNFLKTTRGETGVLHEGYADFFAYVIGGDPNLGETIYPGRPYLRSASLAEGDRYDMPRGRASAHGLGRYWAAFLWELKAEVPEFPAMVYRSLAYLAPTSGIRDAIIALLSVDQATHPNPDTAIHGLHSCAILHRAIARGFTHAMTQIDGSHCGLNLAQIAADRQKEIGVPTNTGPRNQEPSLKQQLGCAMIQGTSPGPWTGLWGLTPLLIVLLLGRRKSHAT